jgi:acid phosphatase type 7
MDKIIYLANPSLKGTVMKRLHMILFGLLVAGCATARLETSKTVALTSDPVLVGAGDIGSCTGLGDDATASLLDNIEGTVFTLGDNAYLHGTAFQFAICYGLSWGRFRDRTFPALGNHDYSTPDASAYFSYFGESAGDPEKGYYSYELGGWHIVVLNSALPVDAGSAQERWLRADLAAHPTICSAAYWHIPRFSSGTKHGSNAEMSPLWQALQDYGADVIINGHEHNYERFAPQDPDGTLDLTKGIREFVVGTGGDSHHVLGDPIANSVVGNDETYGVLKLTLHPTSYDWEFVPIARGSFTDSGSATCVDIRPSTSALGTVK